MKQQRQGRAVTKVKGWQQQSLFTSAELRPYRKNRWKYRQTQLAKERRG